MITTLYYTVERQLDTVWDDMEVAMGEKVIRVYEIANDKPKLWFETRDESEYESTSVIKNWLEDNGFGEREYTFEQL